MQAQKDTAVELHRAKQAELDIVKENAQLQLDLAKIDLVKTLLVLIAAVWIVAVVAGAFSFCCVSLSVIIRSILVSSSFCAAARNLVIYSISFTII